MRTLQTVAVVLALASPLLLGCDSTAEQLPEGSASATTPCNKATVAQGEVLYETMVNGVKRQFWMSIPEADAGLKLPVLMAFHGGGGRPFPFPQQGKFEALAKSKRVIFVRPLSELVAPNEGEWQLNTTDTTRQDIDFVEALLDKLPSTYCVDPKRTYATGYSLGSMFTYELACQLNARFAAIASYAGTMPVAPKSCELNDNVAIMHIHGKDDWIISYKNQWDWKAWDSVGTMMDISKLVDLWGQKNNCKKKNEKQTGPTLHRVHDECDKGVRVEHYGLDAVQHNWPDTINGVSTPQVIWDFLSSFSKS